MLGNLNVSWDDVIGLDKCKAAIKEAIVYPLKYPIFFSDKFSPWKGILLYGPPGTGKLYVRLFPFLVSETFTKISAKRFRAELLTRLDGLLSPEGSNVMLLAATNAPWNIDAALLRRLEKQIYVTLPDEDSRFNLFSSYVSPNIMEEKGNYLVEVTNDYSAAEIKLICKEAWIIQSAPTWNRLENNEITVTNLQFNITSFSSLVHAIKNIQGTDKNIPKYDDWIKS